MINQNDYSAFANFSPAPGLKGTPYKKWQLSSPLLESAFQITGEDYVGIAAAN